MRFAHFFIHRPIFASVLSIITVVVGLISVFRLPVAQYPDIVPPTVVVSGFYPGANAEVISTTVVAPLEEEINGVEDMLYMSSGADDGQFNVIITFKTGTDLDKAQVLVQNRVAIAEPKLPEDVRRMGVITSKQSPDFTVLVQLLSPDNRYDELYLFNYALLNVKDLLARQPGVGQAMLFGGQNYSMRVWIDPEKAASRSLTVGEVVAALREQNVQVAAGTFGQPPATAHTAYQLAAHTKGRLSTPEEFGDIVVKTDGEGKVTRLRDVARLELASRMYNIKSFLNRVPTCALGVFQLPGSNSLETADAVRAAMEQLKRSFPPGLEYRITYDTTLFVRESANEVVKTLLQALLLVVIVVLLFLQNWRASLIPLLAVPVSLIGTFAVMQAAGFSINTLTLFGLVLAIGIVVDDAIVVVENVERNLAAGLPPAEATKKAMDEVSGAVIAITLVLCAVFIPTAFITGFSGRFYQQFALTVASATLFSGFNSLTLSPAMSALLLRHHSEERDWLSRWLSGSLGWLFRGFNALFEGGRRGYLCLLGGLLRKAGIALVLYAGLLGLTWFGFKVVPTGFVPQQDKGYLIAYLQLPDAASLERTEAVSARIAKMFMDQAGIENVIELPGLSMSFGPKPNTAIMFITLKPFQERRQTGLSADVIVGAMQMKLGSIQEGFATVFGAPPVEGIGMLGGYRLQIQDRAGLGFQSLQMATYQVIGAAMEDPRLGRNFTMFRASEPQVVLEVDRTKAKMMNIHLQDLWDTLQVYLGSLYVNDFNLFGRTFQVVAQAEARFRDRPEDIRNFKVRTLKGEMVPLGSLVQVKETTGPGTVSRYNMYRTAEISGSARPGVSSSEAMNIMERLAQNLLPPGMGYEWTELSLLERMSGNTTAFVFPLCVLMVFLVLAALYESWALPAAIILIVPMCILTALTGVFLRGMDNNIFTQIGFVVLVGLAAKNAILIVEFAKQLQERGMPRREAALEACRLRLRPILMTSFALVFGVIPLMFAHGAGAEMRRALGTAVFSGMLGVTAFGIFLTPVFYVVIRALVERFKRGSASTASDRTAVNVPTSLWVAGLGLALWSGGCAAGPNYQPPRTAVPPSFAQGGTSSSTAGVEAAWWRVFHDPLLEKLVEHALATNHDLRIATARVREARALRKAVRLEAAPTVTAQGGYTRALSSRDATGGLPQEQRELGLFDAGFDATWELDLFGRVRRSIQANTAEVASVEAARQEVRVSLVAEVARNYFELRGRQHELAVARQNTENLRETLGLTEALLNAGRGTELDAARARAQWNATLALVPSLEAVVQHAIHRLGVLSGHPPAALQAELTAPQPIPGLPAIVAIGTPEELLRRRPDIRAAERALAAFTARVGMATADLFPRVTFHGRAALEAAHLSGLGQSGSEAYSFGPRISWAALDLGRVRARLKAADAHAEAQLAFYERTVLAALEETENALVDFGRSQARRDYLQASARAAEQAVTLAEDRYRQGVADFLPVLDAQRTLLSVQDQLAQSQTRTATALVSVYKALGGGWELEAGSR